MTRKSWALATAAVVVAAICGVVVMAGAEHPTAAARAPAANTVKVELGELSAMVSQDGTLTYRARPDGSPYPVINQARGVYTRLPDNGDKVDCGGVLYRVDDKPVVLLCGTVPAYRRLHMGVKGRDVRQLNRNLHRRAMPAARSPRRRRRRSRRSSAARAAPWTARLPSVTRSSCPRRCRSPRSPASSVDLPGRVLRC